MIQALKLTRDYNVALEVADLGDWGAHELRSEYDPSVPAIRLNGRILETIPLGEMGTFIALAVGHELHHHRERLGEVERLPERAARERAANAFARSLLEQS